MQETSVEAGGEPSKRRMTSNGLQGVIPQKIEHFITTTVRTSNPITLHKDYGIL
jgi:hypothetical protein